MCISENNKYLVYYRITCFDEAQTLKRNEVAYTRQKLLVEQNFIEHMRDYPDRYKLSIEGSKELLNVFSHYRDALRDVLIKNQEKHRRSQRKMLVSHIIQHLGLNDLENDLAEEWVDFFIMRLTREGFFAWWQPQYSEDSLEIWYYYSENDEADFLEERVMGK